jgi:hypothetical protein
MFSIKRYPLARAILHITAILGLVIAAGASATPAFAAPTNDNIANAIKITAANYAVTVHNAATATTAATDPVISCGASQGQDSLWFSFSPATSGEASINTLSSQYDTILAVFMNDPLVPGNLLEMGCNDNASGTTSAVVLPLRGGIRYFIEVVRKAGTPITATADMHLSYSFATKVVAWGEVLGKKWDSNADSLFAFSSGWSDYPVVGALQGLIKVSNTVNGNAVAYFDGGSFDLYYGVKPNSGNLEVYVDKIFQASIGQNGPFNYPNFVSFGPYSDGVHKLELRHAGGGTEVNFDYIQVYSFPDVIPPARILTLEASTSASTGKVTLKWDAVGDDGNVGTATSYELRYFVDPFIPNCPFHWALGTPYTTGLPAPTVAGTHQQVTLTGLVPNLRYYFCMAAVDEVGNMGIPSNRATAIATAGVPYGTGTYDDANPGWKYTGNWELVNNPDARYNTEHISSNTSDTADFFFTGKQFVFTYITGPTCGLMDVYLDGLYLTTIDQNTFYPNTFNYTSPILVAGPHFLRLVHMTQINVTVDQLYIWSPVDGGPPDPITDLAAIPGVNDGEVILSWTTTGDDPGNVGKAKNYEVRYSSDPINNLVDWDYATLVGGVFPAPLPGGAVQTVTATGLTPGATYYFAVRSFDNAWYDVLSNTVSSFVQYTGMYRPAGTYEDNHSGWEYSTMIPTWLEITDPNATAGHYRRIANAPFGSLARFWFSGTRFQLIFLRDTGYGKLDVYVDGIKIGTINQYFAVADWLSSWTSPILAFGNHVVEFRVLGTRANIDRIKIFP